MPVHVLASVWCLSHLYFAYYHRYYFVFFSMRMRMRRDSCVLIWLEMRVSQDSSHTQQTNQKRSVVT